MSDDSSRNRGFSPSDRRAPFGRYESTDATDPHANAFLVGREAQRRQLLNLLFTHGRRSAYLVTGQRGSGKTAFVEHCIEEYRQDIFGRFLRADAGRAWMDRIGLGLLIAAVTTLAFTLKGVLHFVLYDWEPAPNAYLEYVVAVPIVIALAYPGFAARTLFDAVLERSHSAGSPALDPGTFSSRARHLSLRYRGLLTTLLVLALFVLPPVLRFIVTKPLQFFSFLLCSSLIIGIVCGARFTSQSTPRKAKAIVAARFTLAIFLMAILIVGLSGWLPQVVLDLKPKIAALFTRQSTFSENTIETLSRLRGLFGAYGVYAAAVLAVSALVELVGRLGEEPSTLHTWANERYKQIRQKTILAFKAVCLLSASAHLLGVALDIYHSKTDSGVEPWSQLRSEVITIVLIVLLFVSLSRLEYNWILRPHLRNKAGIRLDAYQAHKDDDEDADEGAMRRFVRHTSFAFLYTSWLPIRNRSPIASENESSDGEHQDEGLSSTDTSGPPSKDLEPGVGHDRAIHVRPLSIFLTRSRCR